MALTSAPQGITNGLPQPETQHWCGFQALTVGRRRKKVGRRRIPISFPCPGTLPKGGPATDETIKFSLPIESTPRI
jgi:hypothetical protein